MSPDNNKTDVEDKNSAKAKAAWLSSITPWEGPFRRGFVISCEVQQPNGERIICVVMIDLLSFVRQFNIQVFHNQTFKATPHVL